MSPLMSINFWCSLLTRIINYDKFLFDWMPKFGWAEVWNYKSANFPRALEHQADTLWKLACQRKSINVTTGYHSLPFYTCEQKSTHIFQGKAIHIQRIIKEVPKFQMVKMNYSSLIESNENTLILRALHEQRWTHPYELCLCKHLDFCAGLVNMQVFVCCHDIGMNKLSSFKRLMCLKKSLAHTTQLQEILEDNKPIWIFHADILRAVLCMPDWWFSWVPSTKDMLWFHDSVPVLIFTQGGLPQLQLADSSNDLQGSITETHSRCI